MEYIQRNITFFFADFFFSSSFFVFSVFAYSLQKLILCICPFNAAEQKLVLTIAVISKGKQTTAKIQQHQFDDLFTFPNKQKAFVEVESQQVQEQFVPEQQPFRPIIFPSSDEDRDIVIERFPTSLSPSPSQIHSANLILQNVDQKFPAHSPTAELARPTRVAVPVAAATAASEILSSRFTDDQLDYVRNFAWNMFKVQNVYFFYQFHT